MKIAFVLIGALSLVAATSLTIQNGIDEVNKYLSGQTSDLSGILYFLRHNALISYNDYNVFIEPLNNNVPGKEVATTILKHLQIDQAIQDIKNVQSRNSGDDLFHALNSLLNKDLLKQVLLTNNDYQASINSLNNQVAPEDVAGSIIKHLQIEQAIQALKNFQLGDSGNSNTLTNILNNDLVNEGVISHQDYDNFKGQLKKGEEPNRVANAVVGFLFKRKDVQIIIRNFPYDQAIQVLENYRAADNGDENELFNILHNNLLNNGLISQQEYSGFKDGYNDKNSPINGDLNGLANAAIELLNSKKQVQSD